MAKDEKGRFMPGESGNPAGRPKKEVSITHLLREYSKEKDESGKEHREIMVAKMFELAKTGDIQAFKEIMNRIEGLPVQTQVIQGDIEYTITPPVKPDDLDL